MKKFLIALLIFFLFAAAVGLYAYKMIFSPNALVDQEQKMITIPSGSSFEDVLAILKSEDILSNQAGFTRVASLMSYKDSSVRAGKYTIQPNMSNKDLVSILRSGRQTPIKITFNNLRTKEDLAGKISSYIEIDSMELVHYFQDAEVQESVGLNNETFISLFIPNTYEFFWTVKKKNLLSRMQKEHADFWSKNDREAKADKLGLSKEEVYTLASIVEKESQRNQEKPTLAGVYLNRINIGMPLQADPTVVFATGEFGLRRVLNRHLEFDSPYNTYKYPGLPPGPIYMPGIPSIDAVLNREDHKYLYFCSSPEIQGAHLFAESLSQHNANARRYHRWLDRQGIR